MQYLIALILIPFVYLILIHKKKKKKELENNNWHLEKEENFNFHLIGKYFRNRANIEQDYYHLISDKISIDLDLDDVFKKIDRTTSKIGQQYLYYKIRIIKKSFTKLDKFSDLVNFFKENESKRQQCIKKLSNLKSER